jgi:hypothetical protein
MVQVEIGLPVWLTNDETVTGPGQHWLVAAEHSSNGGVLCVHDNVMSSDWFANTGTHCANSCVERNKPAANNVTLKSKLATRAGVVGRYVFTLIKN